VSSVLSAARRDGQDGGVPPPVVPPVGGDPGQADEDGRFTATVTAVAAAFGDPTRRDIFLHVRSRPGASASEVAAAFSLHPNVARHHLDRLVSAGYLQVEVERREQGAGRPSKRFSPAGDDPVIGFLNHRDDLLSLLLREAMELLGPEAAEQMAAKVGEEYGRQLAARMSPADGQRSVRAAMHAIAETLTAHGFAAHAEDRDTTTAVVAEHCPFGAAATANPVLCAVDRGMVAGLLAGLCGQSPAGGMPVVLTSRARGDDSCTALA
jgi:predicted ArsR family transcriptional regulator